MKKKSNCFLIEIKYKDYFGHNKIISDMNKTDILYLN